MNKSFWLVHVIIFCCVVVLCFGHDAEAYDFYENFQNHTDTLRFVTTIPNKNSEVRDGTLWTRGESGGKYPPMRSLGVEGKDERDVLALVTYDGSVHEDKTATVVKYNYHSACNQWHEMSVTLGGDLAIVCLDDEVYTVSSRRYLEPIEKCRVGHFLGALQTWDAKIQKHKKL